MHKKNIPLSVEKRLSKISSDVNIFNEACPPYQKAQSEAGYDHILEFNPPVTTRRKNRSRRQKFFNPPFSSSVKTNIGAKFLKLIDQCFPKTHALHKILNRNTVKISYKCMPNMKCIIARQNSKILKGPEANSEPPPPCSHREGTTCPLGGACKTPSLVYKATVTSGSQLETYTGLTEPPFQKRWHNHQTDFRHQKNRSNTALASHIWSLKDQSIDYSLNFEILKKTRAFNQINGICMLCLYKKYFILFNPTGSTLKLKDFERP